MEYTSKWDELNLKINEIQLFSNLINNGINEVELLNIVISIHNRAFEKGKKVVLDELRFFK